MTPRPNGATPPLRNEKKPRDPVDWIMPQGAIRYRVQDGDTWQNVARKFNVWNGAPYLIAYNFRVFVDPRTPGKTDEVNWYLREYVGCNVTTDGGNNWAFSKSAYPGFIYVPPSTAPVDTQVALVSYGVGVGGVLAVPEYDDDTVIDAVGKAFDVYGAVDMGLAVSGVVAPVAVEIGGIVGGAITGVLGPILAVAGPHADALKTLNRDHFFEGFSIGVVMSANGERISTIKALHELKTPPANSVYPEKRETFRKLHNQGLAFGIQKGKKFSKKDVVDFFTYLLSKIPDGEREQYSPRYPWREWSAAKRKEYYVVCSLIVKHAMLENDLQLTFKR